MTNLSDFDGAIADFMQELGFQAIYMQATSIYDPATGTNNVSYTEIPVQAIQVDLNLRSNGMSVGNGTLIQDGDKQLYIRPPNKTDPLALFLTVNPAADKVKINDTIWRILTFKEINPDASNQVLIELYIRR
jgi:hypothetical protein